MLRQAILSIVTLGACAGAMATVCPPSGSCSAQASLRITVVVPRHAAMRIEKPPLLRVTAEDVARGWMETEAPLQVQVRSNVREGYALVFEQRGQAVRGIQILGLRTPLTLAGGPAMDRRPATGPGMWTDEVALRFRFELRPDAVPGDQPWPVHISLQAP